MIIYSDTLFSSLPNYYKKIKTAKNQIICRFDHMSSRNALSIKAIGMFQNTLNIFQWKFMKLNEYIWGTDTIY